MGAAIVLILETAKPNGISYANASQYLPDEFLWWVLLGGWIVGNSIRKGKAILGLIPNGHNTSRDVSTLPRMHPTSVCICDSETIGHHY